MVWIDAHGDCNTPETTSSGMLSGMPVAIATGLCLERLRRQVGLDPPIAAAHVVMVCVRANDPLERELIDRSASRSCRPPISRRGQPGFARRSSG